MGSVYRETYTKPVPAGAELFTSKGQPFARIKPAKGRTQSHPVTVGRNGAPRIVKTAGTYTAKYRDAAGIVQKVATGCRDEGAARSILNELERRAELVRAGVLSASEDAIADHSGTPLGEHLENMNEAIIRARAALAEAPDRVRRLEWCGRERGLIYRTLLLTGLRRGELASLKIGSIEIDGPTPHAVLAAEDEKNRKGSTIPLRSDLVVELRSWISGKQEAFSGPRRAFLNEPLFSVPKKLTKVLNRDIEVAGIPKKDERGRTVDVHAMRMTFATLLSKGGVAPKVAQIALRHSDIRLTMQTYTDSKLFDIAGALDSLPPLSLNGIRNQSEATCATATDPVLVPVLVPTVGHQGQSESSAVTLTGDLGSPVQLSHTEENTPKPTKKALSDEKSDGLLQVGETGFEPATPASQTQCSSQAELLSDERDSRGDLRTRQSFSWFTVWITRNRITCIPGLDVGTCGTTIDGTGGPKPYREAVSTFVIWLKYGDFIFR